MPAYPYTRFYFADPDDPLNEAKIRLDLNKLGRTWEDPNPTGFGLLGNLDLGTIETESVWVTQGGRAGAVQAQANHPVVTMNFKLWMLAADVNEALTLTGALQTECRRGGTIVWQPKGATEPRYIEIFRSKIPALFNGQDLVLNKITEMFMMDSAGVTVTLWRWPYLFGPTINDHTVKANVGNAASERALVVDNPGSLTTPARLRVQPNEAGSRLVTVTAGIRNDRPVDDSIAGAISFEVDNAQSGVTFYGDTTMQLDADASNGNAAQTLTPGKAWRRRWWMSKSAPTSGAYNGTWQAVAVVRASGSADADAENTTYKAQLRWTSGGTSAADPAQESSRVVVFDTSDVNRFPWVQINFGPIEIEDDDVTFEGWLKRVDGPNNGFWWDTLTLIPLAGMATVATIPEYAEPHANESAFFGAEMEIVAGAPAAKGDTMVLNELGETVKGPDQPEVLPAGHHHVVFECELRNLDADTPGHRRVNLGRVQILENGIEIEKLGLWTKRDQTLTKVRRRLTFHSDGSASYEFRVKMRDTTTDPDWANVKARIVVNKVVHSVHRYAGPNDVMVIDAITERARLRANNTKDVMKLDLKGGYPFLQPGKNLIVFAFGDLPPPGYDDVSDNQNLTKHPASQTCTVSVDLQPRYGG